MANLSQIRRARIACKKKKVRMVWKKDHVYFYFPSGRFVKVWYPMEGRANNVEEKDLDEMIKEVEICQN